MKRNNSSGKGYAVLAFIPLSLLAIAACSTTAGTTPPPAREDGGMCTADNVDQFVGKPATAEIGASIQRTTGARIFRWLPEGTIVTMEYRGDRVNVDLNTSNNIRSVRCG